jgi:NhaC family Na+:H+ antiporter
MIVKKVPALPALLLGALLGGISAIIFQPQIINEVSGVEGNFIKSAFVAVMNAMTTKINIQTNDPMITDLLTA